MLRFFFIGFASRHQVTAVSGQRRTRAPPMRDLYTFPTPWQLPARLCGDRYIPRIAPKRAMPTPPTPRIRDRAHASRRSILVFFFSLSLLSQDHPRGATESHPSSHHKRSRRSFQPRRLEPSSWRCTWTAHSTRFLSFVFCFAAPNNNTPQQDAHHSFASRFQQHPEPLRATAAHCEHVGPMTAWFPPTRALGLP